MDEFVAAGDESAERSQPLSGSSGLPPILSGIEIKLPAIIAAEEALARAIFASGHLSRSEVDDLITAAGNEWPGQVRDRAMPTVETPSRDSQKALAQFGCKLARYGPWCSKCDCDALISAGYTENAIRAAVAAVALGHFRCTLSAGLFDFEGTDGTPSSALSTADLPQWKPSTAPFILLSSAPSDVLDTPFSQIRALFGFVPNILQLQSSLPDVVATEVQLIDAVLCPEEHLSQTQKHCILLSLAAANCNNYLVGLHGEILGLLGITPQETLSLLNNLETSSISDSDKAFCMEVRKLRMLPGVRKQTVNKKLLVDAGFSETQIVEGLVTAALANFLSIVQFGLGANPDFRPLRTFFVKDLYLSEADIRPTVNEVVFEDPDFELVLKVKAGETDAFELLVRNHTRRIFRTLNGLMGNPEEARDATQDTFLKAFEHIDKFEGRSKFSTWLTSIAVNTGTEILRRRRPIESLDVEDDEHGFRPRQVRSWIDSPEEALAKSQVNDIVRKGVLRLPEKYRAALLLRDINQLSTEDTAEALGLSLPATKARILRGRLMLRESLAPHFTRGDGD